eukprot:SM000197S05477  [mRNA]  locus=s197:245380:250444:- [translate_table: standard]
MAAAVEHVLSERSAATAQPPPAGEKRSPFLPPILGRCADSILAVCWLSWVWFIFAWSIFATNWGYNKVWKPLDINPSRWMHGYEGYSVMYLVPLYLIALLAPLYFASRALAPGRKRESGTNVREKLSRAGRFVLLSRTPLGPLTVTEIFWASVVTAVIVYQFAKYQNDSIKNADSPDFDASVEPRYQYIWDAASVNIGWVGFLPLIVIFIPVTRGSALLRLCGIPFEQAVKYHRWLCVGHFVLELLHAIGYFSLWIDQERLWKESFNWQEFGIANLPGVIAIIILLVIFFSSLEFVRRKRFELFFYLHYLYLPYMVFVALHLGDFGIFYILPGLTFFGIDRIARAVQSWNLVRAESVTSMADSRLEIVIPIASGVQYKPLDIVFINVPVISRLQWHPFSISSSPLDGRRSLSVIMKPLGGWTRKLAAHVEALGQQPLLLKVEGPYGQEQDLLMKYDELLLAAGGIGITPFMSLLSHLAHRCRQPGAKTPLLVTLVWAVRREEDLHKLGGLDWADTCSQLPEHVRIVQKLHVTGAQAPDAEQGHVKGNRVMSLGSPSKHIQAMHCKVGQGNDIRNFLFALFTLGIAFFVLLAFLRSIAWPLDHGTYEVMSTAQFAWMVIGGLISGILVAMIITVPLWYLLLPSTHRQQGTLRAEECPRPPFESNLKKLNAQVSSEHQAIATNTAVYGCRPPWDAIFKELIDSASPGANIGVLVSGPTGMSDEVALQCVKHTAWPLFGGKRPVLNFHSAAFEL